MVCLIATFHVCMFLPYSFVWKFIWNLIWCLDKIWTYKDYRDFANRPIIYKLLSHFNFQLRGRYIGITLFGTCTILSERTSTMEFTTLFPFPKCFIPNVRFILIYIELVFEYFGVILFQYDKLSCYTALFLIWLCVFKQTFYGGVQSHINVDNWKRNILQFILLHFRTDS